MTGAYYVRRRTFLRKVESGGDSADGLCAAVPIAIHVEELAVKPDGINVNRIVDEGNDARARIARNSPDGRREIFPKHLLGADPRALPGRLPRQRPAPLLVARGPAGDTGNSVDGGTRATLRLPPGLTGTPTPPAVRCILTHRTAIPRLGMLGLKELLAVFQQAAPSPRSLTRALP